MKGKRMAVISLENNCYYCHCVFDGDRTTDHIVAKKLGGNDTYYNRIYACCDCNVLKGSMFLEAFLATILRMPWKENKISKIAYKITQLIQYRDANLNQMITIKPMPAPKFMKTEEEDIADRTPVFVTKPFPNFWT